jgi:hypothetical protein
MKLYKTREFTSIHTGTIRKGIVYCVFSDTERSTIKDVHLALMKIYTDQSSIPDWNKNDMESLYQIIKWAYTFKDGGKHADLSEDQILKINKMLVKLLNNSETTFSEVFNIYMDDGLDIEDYMGDREMRKEQDRRRMLNASLDQEPTLFSQLFDYTAV